MKISHEQLLAYSLGEITSAEEREELEKEIQRDPNLQRELAELDHIGNEIRSAFKQSEDPVLDPNRASKIRVLSQSQRRSLDWRWLTVPATAAALVLLLFNVRLPEGPHITAAHFETPVFVETVPEEPADSGATETESDSILTFEEGQESKKEGFLMAKADQLPEGASANQEFGADITKNNAPIPMSTPPAVASVSMASTSSMFGVSAATGSKTQVLDQQPMPFDPVDRPNNAKGDYRSRATPAESSLAAAPGTLPPPPATEVLRNTEYERGDRAGAPLMASVQTRSAGISGEIAISGSLSAKIESRGGESYNAVTEPDFISPRQAPLSTFSIDVDTASYTNIRRILNSGSLPPHDAVRVEEMLNFFRYDYAKPNAEQPAVSVLTDIATCPWNPSHRLARVALQGRALDAAKRPASNLVFLIDVSGSMSSENKLPLVKQALETLVGQLRDDDRVAIVTYAGNSGVALPSTTVAEKDKILETIRNLSPGGSTNGASGIELAYEQASSLSGEGFNSRVILLTDGDFNVGVTSQESLKSLIKSKASKSDIYLSVFGFGMGNLKDSTLETLSQNGNGQYGYIDSFKEAQRVFVSQLSGTLVTIAKDVKLQIEFNPAKVAGYRLVGYENRKLADADFRDDTKDAGEMGAGHTVTALYEIIPANADAGGTALRYQQTETEKPAAKPSDETMNVAIRYLDKATDKRVEYNRVLVDAGTNIESADADFRFASGVASFGMLLRDSKFKGEADYQLVFKLITDSASGPGTEALREERAELVDLVRKAASLTGNE